MKNLYFFAFAALLIMAGCQPVRVQNGMAAKETKMHTVIYFNPEVFPDIDEIKEPTYSAFYAAVSERINHLRNYKMLRVDSNIPFDSVDSQLVKEYCLNNNAQFAMIPKVKYFKVGLGKYVFSNQVIISLKLYDSAGNFLTEADYDTYKKNARILGSAENSIKIGTIGAMKNIGENLKKSKPNFLSSLGN